MIDVIDLIVQMLLVLGFMFCAWLFVAGTLVALGKWQGRRNRWDAIDEVRPPDSEGHTGALKVFYKGGRILDAEFSEVASHRSPR